MMTIVLEDAKLEDLALKDFNQKAYHAFKNYWQGSDDEFYAYMQNHKLDYDFKFENTVELNEKTYNFLLNLAEAVRKDIGKFDFRISTALTGRNLKPLEMEDYVKVTLFSDEINTKDIYDTFLNFDSRSFVDFRSYNEHDNTLIFIYNRRGIFDENERIAILKSKKSATMSDNFKSAKDNNFILSGLCHELAKKNGIGFRFEYIGVGDALKEISMSAEQILNIAEAKEEKREEAIQERVIKEEARAEIVKENAQTRQSLGEDSTKQEIYKEANTEIRLDISKEINIENLDKVVDEGISNYEKKEQEKLRIRLEKAKKDAPIIYKEMQERIANDGMSIFEAINYVKQKYREDHAVNMASAFLTKDILEVEILKTEVADQKQHIFKLDNEIIEKGNEITKREDTISSLKATVQTKVNEITNLQLQHEQEKEILVQEAKKKFNELDNEFNKEINHHKDIIASKYEEIEQQNELINRLSGQLELLNNQFEKLTSKNEVDVRENENLKRVIKGIDFEKLDNKSVRELNKILEDINSQNEIKSKAIENMRFEDILAEEDDSEKLQERPNPHRQGS